MLNEMMDRPIVKEDIVEFMREELAPFTGTLGDIQAYANERRIPIIPHETAKFLDFFCAIQQPKYILEIGTAIGFSASLLEQRMVPGGHLTTIERNPVMYERAHENFEKQKLTDRIRLLEGDAVDILETLPKDHFDLIFMDSAKAKYIEFLPTCLQLLHEGGVIIIDDVFQGGTVLSPEAEIPRRVRKIHRKLNELLEKVLKDDALLSTLVPLGDGLLLIRKEPA